MTKAFVLMTALPPTKGHLQLLQFSEALAEHTIALVCTQPGEPFATERFMALAQACRGRRITVRHHHAEIEQNPEAPTFHAMWKILLEQHGMRPGDYLVASESWGLRFASQMGMKFMPYDVNRDISYTKAELVRLDPFGHFDWILPEFQVNLRQTVTFIGAESTGKTTISKWIAAHLGNAYWLFEWARPYLEQNKVEEITYEAMNDIWVGQRALENHVHRNLRDRPWIIQDTDLFATVGYWNFWKGDTPEALIKDAVVHTSDLYIIPRSNIPFENDPIRYGGSERESNDEFWIALAEQYNLNYVVLEGDTLDKRIREVLPLLNAHRAEVAATLQYERAFNE